MTLIVVERTLVQVLGVRSQKHKPMEMKQVVLSLTTQPIN